MSRAPRAITVFSHTRPTQTSEALATVLELARAADVEVRLPEVEVDKHSVAPRDGVVLGADPALPSDLALVLGGDGTILSTLRLYAGRGVPVFAVNYGAIGFLATVEPDGLRASLERALRGEFDVMALPALVARSEDGERIALNDISFHRRHDGRVAELAYSVQSEQLGEVRCDGLVAATPAGSTGYNLANGGPVLAWGVEGFVVSFIAPHTLTARALVVAPSDDLRVTNRSHSERVDMTTDGRPVGALVPGATVEIGFRAGSALLAQTPGTSFYQRLRDKFGRLAY